MSKEVIQFDLPVWGNIISDLTPQQYEIKEARELFKQIKNLELPIEYEFGTGENKKIINLSELKQALEVVFKATDAEFNFVGGKIGIAISSFVTSSLTIEAGKEELRAYLKSLEDKPKPRDVLEASEGLGAAPAVVPKKEKLGFGSRIFKALFGKEDKQAPADKRAASSSLAAAKENPDPRSAAAQGAPSISTKEFEKQKVDKTPDITNQTIETICWSGTEAQVKELIQNQNVLKRLMDDDKLFVAAIKTAVTRRDDCKALNILLSTPEIRAKFIQNPQLFVFAVDNCTQRDDDGQALNVLLSYPDIRSAFLVYKRAFNNAIAFTFASNDDGRALNILLAYPDIKSKLIENKILPYKAVATAYRSSNGSTLNALLSHADIRSKFLEDAEEFALHIEGAFINIGDPRAYVPFFERDKEDTFRGDNGRAVETLFAFQDIREKILQDVKLFSNALKITCTQMSSSNGTTLVKLLEYPDFRSKLAQDRELFLTTVAKAAKHENQAALKLLFSDPDVMLKYRETLEDRSNFPLPQSYEYIKKVIEDIAKTPNSTSDDNVAAQSHALLAKFESQTHSHPSSPERADASKEKTSTPQYAAHASKAKENDSGTTEEPKQTSKWPTVQPSKGLGPKKPS